MFVTKSTRSTGHVEDHNNLCNINYIKVQVIVRVFWGDSEGINGNNDDK